MLLDPLAKELFGTGEAARQAQIVNNEAKLGAYLTAFTFSFLDRQNKALHLYNPASKGDLEYAARSGKIYDARGQVAYTVTVLRDFSTWKKLEQLQMERRLLEMEKFAATGKLAGTIAHEINNPLDALSNVFGLPDVASKRNIWVAEGPQYKARQLTRYNVDDGQELTDLAFSADGNWIVFVRGASRSNRWSILDRFDQSMTAV